MSDKGGKKEICVTLLFVKSSAKICLLSMMDECTMVSEREQLVVSRAFRDFAVVDYRCNSL